MLQRSVAKVDVEIDEGAKRKETRLVPGFIGDFQENMVTELEF